MDPVKKGAPIDMSKIGQGEAPVMRNISTPKPKKGVPIDMSKLGSDGAQKLFSKKKPVVFRPEGNAGTDLLKALPKGAVQHQAGKLGAAKAVLTEATQKPTVYALKVLMNQNPMVPNPMGIGPNIHPAAPLLDALSQSEKPLSPLDKLPLSAIVKPGIDNLQKAQNKLMDLGEKIQPTDPIIEGTWRYPDRRIARVVGKAALPMVEAMIITKGLGRIAALNARVMPFAAKPTPNLAAGQALNTTTTGAAWNFNFAPKVISNVINPSSAINATRGGGFLRGVTPTTAESLFKRGSVYGKGGGFASQNTSGIIGAKGIPSRFQKYFNKLENTEVTGAQVLGGYSFFPSQMGSFYDEQIANGVPHSEAFDRAVSVAHVVSFLEMIPIINWSDKLKGLAWYKRFRSQGVAEMSEEISQGLTENLSRMEAYSGYDNFFQKLADGMIDSAVAGLLLGGVTGMLTPATVDDYKAEIYNKNQRRLKHALNSGVIDRAKYDELNDRLDNVVSVSVEKALRSADTVIREVLRTDLGELSGGLEINIGNNYKSEHEVSAYNALPKEKQEEVRERTRVEWNRFVKKNKKRKLLEFEQLPTSITSWVLHNAADIAKTNTGASFRGTFNSLIAELTERHGVNAFFLESTARKETDRRKEVAEKADKEDPTSTQIFIPELMRAMNIKEFAQWVKTEDISPESIMLVWGKLKGQDSWVMNVRRQLNEELEKISDLKRTPVKRDLEGDVFTAASKEFLNKRGDDQLLRNFFKLRGVTPEEPAQVSAQEQEAAKQKILDALKKVLPKSVVKAIKIVYNEAPGQEAVRSGIEGWADKTGAYLDASVVTPEDAPKVALHELSHVGMIKLAEDLGGAQELMNILSAAEDHLMEALPELLERTGHKSLEDLMESYNSMGMSTESGRLAVLTELSARWAERFASRPKETWWKQLAKNIIGWFKKFAGVEFSEAEVDRLIAGFVAYGTKRINNGINNPLKTLLTAKKDLLAQAVQSRDYRAIIKSLGIQYPKHLSGNYAAEEIKKVQALFRKNGTSLDKAVQELKSLYPELAEIERDVDLLRLAIDQTEGSQAQGESAWLEEEEQHLRNLREGDIEIELGLKERGITIEPGMDLLIQGVTWKVFSIDKATDEVAIGPAEKPTHIISYSGLLRSIISHEVITDKQTAELAEIEMINLEEIQQRVDVINSDIEKKIVKIAKIISKANDVQSLTAAQKAEIKKRVDEIEQIFKNPAYSINKNKKQVVDKLKAQNEETAPAKKQTEVNIWHGTGENAELSNLAYRPFKLNDVEYLSVEHAYQTLKSGEFDQVTYDKYKALGEKVAGQKISGLKKADTETNIQLMETLIFASFQQNPKEANKLLATGDSKLTHSQDKGIWKEEFPRILEKVRARLLSESKIGDKARLAESDLIHLEAVLDHVDGINEIIAAKLKNILRLRGNEPVKWAESKEGRKPSFAIVNKGTRYSVFGMRGPKGEHMNTPGIKPGTRGWLGNPFKWAGDYGPKDVTLQEAIAKFKEAFLEKVATDEQFVMAIRRLRGREVAYYKPKDLNHLQVIQEWLKEDFKQSNKQQSADADGVKVEDLEKESTEVIDSAIKLIKDIRRRGRGLSFQGDIDWLNIKAERLQEIENKLLVIANQSLLLESKPTKDYAEKIPVWHNVNQAIEWFSRKAESIYNLVREAASLHTNVPAASAPVPTPIAQRDIQIFFDFARPEAVKQQLIEIEQLTFEIDELVREKDGLIKEALKEVDIKDFPEEVGEEDPFPKDRSYYKRKVAFGDPDSGLVKRSDAEKFLFKKLAYLQKMVDAFGDRDVSENERGLSSREDIFGELDSYPRYTGNDGKYTLLPSKGVDIEAHVNAAKSAKEHANKYQKPSVDSWKRESMDRMEVLKDGLHSLAKMIRASGPKGNSIRKVNRLGSAILRENSDILQSNMSAEEKQKKLDQNNKKLQDLLRPKEGDQEHLIEQMIFQDWITEHEELLKDLEAIFGFTIEQLIINPKVSEITLQGYAYALDKKINDLAHGAEIKAEQRRAVEMETGELIAPTIGDDIDSITAKILSPEQTEEQVAQTEQTQTEEEKEQAEQDEVVRTEAELTAEDLINGTGRPRYNLSGQAVPLLPLLPGVGGRIEQEVTVLDINDKEHTFSEGQHFVMLPADSENNVSLEINGQKIVIPLESVFELAFNNPAISMDQTFYSIKKDGKETLEKSEVDNILPHLSQRRPDFRIFMKIWKVLTFPAHVLSAINPSLEKLASKKAGLDVFKALFFRGNQERFDLWAKKVADTNDLPEAGELMDLLWDTKLAGDMASVMGYMSVEGIARQVDALIEQHLPAVCKIVASEPKFKQLAMGGKRTFNREVKLEARRRLHELSSKILSSAFPEIIATPSDTQGEVKYAISDTGLRHKCLNRIYKGKPELGPKHEERSLAERFEDMAGRLLSYGLMPMEDYLALQKEIKKGYRPRLLFFNMLKYIDRGLQNTAVWAKGNIETPMLLEMLKSGMWSGADMVSNVMKGYMFRYHKKPEDKNYIGYNVSNLGNVWAAEADYETYEEFIKATRSRKLIVIDDFYSSMEKYVADGVVRLNTLNTINLLRQVRNPDDLSAPIVAYTDDAFLDLLPGETAEKKLTDLNYVRVKNMNVLTQWHKGIFLDPWIHQSLLPKMDEMFGPQAELVPILEKAGEVQSAIKRYILSNVVDSFLLNMGSAAVELPLKEVVDKIAKPAIRTIMNPVGTIRDINKTGQDILNDRYWRNQFYTKNTLKAMRAGLVFNFHEVSKSLFDKAWGTAFPGTKGPAERTRDYLDSVFGGNAWLYDKHIANVTLSLWEHMYKRNLKTMNPIAAARSAANFVNSTSLIVNRAEFGKHSKLWQLAFFTRNIAFGSVMTLSSALSPIWAGTATGKLDVNLFNKTYSVPWWGETGLHKYRHGASGAFNAIALGTRSQQTLDREWQMYLNHLIKAVFKGILLMGAFQFALSFMDDDEWDEHGERGSEKGLMAKKRWIWNNEDGKHLFIRTPWQDNTKRRIYLDTQFFKHIKLISDIMVKGPGRFVRNRANIFLPMFTELLFNKDFVTGDAISPDALKDSEHAYEYYTNFWTRFLGNYALPLGVRPEDMSRVPGAPGALLNFFQVHGAQMRRGLPLEGSPNYTWKDARDLRNELAVKRYQDQKIDDKLRNADYKKLREAFQKGEISLESYKRRVRKLDSPMSQLMKEGYRSSVEREMDLKQAGKKRLKLFDKKK